MLLKHIDENLQRHIEKHYEQCCKLNDELADYPEISGEEERSFEKIKNILNMHGIPVEGPLCNQDYSFIANIVTCNNPKIKVAILMEYDALPQIGHACGHCVSGSISLLAALALRDTGKEIHVDLIGTPDEEVRGAKTYMAQGGVFDGYDFAIMIHMDNKNRTATRSLCIMDLQVDFFGKSSHAASAPWEGKNALNGVQLFFHAMDMLRQHVPRDIMMHGIITAGGTAANIVPEKASAYVYVRGNRIKDARSTMDKLYDCAKGAALATQTHVELKSLYPAYQETIINLPLKKIVGEIFEELQIDCGENDSIPMGSTGLGNVSGAIPVICPTLKISESDIHTLQFAKNVKKEKAHRAIGIGAYVIARTILQAGEYGSEFLLNK